MTVSAAIASASDLLNAKASRPAKVWLFGTWAEIFALFALMMVYIWGIQEFSISFTLSILALAFASNAIRGHGCAHVGLCWNRFRRALWALWPIMTAIAIVMLAAGAGWHTFRNISLRTAIVGFLLYCIWGLFQQYLLNGFFLNRLLEIGSGIRRGWLLLISAAVFSIAHAPNWFLMGITLPAGFVCGLIYLKYRNLLVLGLAHAIIGCLLYLVIPDSVSHGLYVGPNCWAFCRAAR